MDTFQKNETPQAWNNTFSSDPSSMTMALQAALIIFIMVIVIIGNVIVLLVVYRQRIRPTLRVANMFIGNLALVDLSIGLFLFPFSVITILLHRWTFGDALCQFNGAMNVIAGAASILTMAVISIDRYRAIVSPPGRRVKAKQAWVLLTALWTASIIIGVLPVLGWNKYTRSSLHTMCKMSFTEDRGYILLVAVTCFLIPLIVMCYCYLRVFVKVHFHKKQVQRWSNSREAERNFQRETKTTRVVFTVLFVFVACWTPFVIVHILQAFPSISMSRIVFHCVTLFAGLHSACNPIIYITMNKTFRKEFLQMCSRGPVTCCERHDRVQPFNMESSSTLPLCEAKPRCNTKV